MTPPLVTDLSHGRRDLSHGRRAGYSESRIMTGFPWSQIPYILYKENRTGLPDGARPFRKQTILVQLYRSKQVGAGSYTTGKQRRGPHA